jgi:type VI secretion system protein ImpC
MATKTTSKAPSQEVHARGMSDFASLLRKEFKPQSDKAKESVEVAVRTLAEQALAGTNLLKGDVLATIEA